MQCYNNKFGLINLNPIVKEMNRYLDETKMKEKDIKRREKALQAYIEGRKLTEEEIDRAVPSRSYSLILFVININPFRKCLSS